MSSTPLQDPELPGGAIPRRVVSLVPSMTESLFELGLGAALAGVSDYCTRPAESLAGLPRVGGPKNARVGDIVMLQPDLVIANREENTPEIVEALCRAGVPVWLTFPLTVRDALDDLWKLARLFRSEAALLRVQTLERSVEWSELALEDFPPVRYFCPVWQECDAQGEGWWMTFNAQTYSSDLLRAAGGENVFAARERRYPLEADLGRLPAEPARGRDVRYPRVTRAEILAAQPEVILLPDEPYAYAPSDLARFREWFAETPAGQNNKIYTVDGSLVTWCGTRLALALNELPGLLRQE